MRTESSTALSVGAVYSGTLWINQGLFDKYNLKPPTTLDEWDKVCQEFKANDQGCFVQGAAGAGFDQDTLQAIANSVEPGLWTRASKGEAPWNSPGMVKALDIWEQLFDARHHAGGCGRLPAVPGRQQRLPHRQVRDGHDGHLVHPVLDRRRR